MTSGRGRAQSESIGVILLTAVIVILVGGFGVVYLGTTGGGQALLVDAEVNATDEWVSITHGGGESVAIDELDVVVRLDGASERHSMDVANVSGGGDGAFDPGDRYRRDHGLGAGSMEVLLVHVSSNEVLHHDHLDARAGD